MNLHRTVHPILAALLAAAPCATTAWAGPKGVGIDLAGMDRSVAPGDDFFAHANGDVAQDDRDPGRPRRPTARACIVIDLTNERTAELIEEAARQARRRGRTRGRSATTTRATWTRRASRPRACAPLQPTLDRIAAHRRPQGPRPRPGRHAARRRGRAQRHELLHRQPVRPLGRAGPRRPDALRRRSCCRAGSTCPTATTTWTRRRAWRSSAPSTRRTSAPCLKLAGIAGRRRARGARLRAGAPHRRGPRSREESEDVKKANNRWTREDFDTRAPGLDWAAFFAAAGLGAQRGVHRLAAAAPSPGISALVGQPAARHLEGLPALPRHRALRRRACPRRSATSASRSTAPCSPARPQRRERWKRAVDVTNDALGEAVGQLYVERYFPPAAKARVEEMVAEPHGRLRPAHRRARLDGAGHQGQGEGQAGRAEGRRRLSRPVARLRRPRGRARRRASATRSARSCSSTAQRCAKLGQPVDRGEWVMTPQTVNAVNLPVMNAMNFPAAILQPPYFDPDAAAGHGLRRHRRRSSATRSATASTTRARSSTPRAGCTTGGRAQDLEHFEEAAAQLVKQYDALPPFPDLAVNGKLTLSENIADVAGLAAAYDAYRLSLRRQAGAGRGRPHRRPAVLPRASPRAGAARCASRRCASRS